MESKREQAPVYTIGEVAEKLKVSVETIRLYERKGLIIVSKSENGQRVFSEGDIDRLKCIRSAINEDKISIEGVRRMQSLVPCWEHIHCPQNQWDKCPAFMRMSGGCWTYAASWQISRRAARHPAQQEDANERDTHSDNECGRLDCRACKVYQLSGSCESIKSLIYQNILPASQIRREQENKP